MSSVPDNGPRLTTGKVRPEIQYRICPPAQEIYPSPEPLRRRLEQSVKSTFDAGLPAHDPYRPVSMAEVHRKSDGTTWEWIPRRERAPQPTVQAIGRVHTCVACGSTFSPSRSDARTCSSRCRKRLQRTPTVEAQP